MLVATARSALLVQYGGRVDVAVNLGRCAWAGVVRHHAPPLRGSHIHIGRGNECDLRAICCVNLNPLNQVMNCTGDSFKLVQSLGEGANRPMAEHDFKRIANGHRTNQAGTAWMNTNDVFFIGPTGHQALKIACLQGLIKGSLYLIGGTANGGCAQMRL